jgi:hypothetical protein
LTKHLICIQQKSKPENREALALNREVEASQERAGWAQDGSMEKLVRNSQLLASKRHVHMSEKRARFDLESNPEDSTLFNGTFIIVPSPFQNQSWGTET